MFNLDTFIFLLKFIVFALCIVGNRPAHEVLGHIEILGKLPDLGHAVPYSLLELTPRDQAVYCPGVCLVLVLLADIQRRVLIIKSAVDTVTQLVRQFDRLISGRAYLPRVQSNSASAADRNRDTNSN